MKRLLIISAAVFLLCGSALIVWNGVDRWKIQKESREWQANLDCYYRDTLRHTHGMLLGFNEFDFIPHTKQTMELALDLLNETVDKMLVDGYSRADVSRFSLEAGNWQMRRKEALEARDLNTLRNLEMNSQWKLAEET